MGEFRFRLPDDWTLASRQASSIHVVGLDGIPWPCRVFTEGKTLVVRRNRDDVRVGLQQVNTQKAVVIYRSIAVPNPKPLQIGVKTVGHGGPRIWPPMSLICPVATSPLYLTVDLFLRNPSGRARAPALAH